MMFAGRPPNAPRGPSKRRRRRSPRRGPPSTRLQITTRNKALTRLEKATGKRTLIVAGAPSCALAPTSVEVTSIADVLIALSELDVASVEMTAPWARTSCHIGRACWARAVGSCVMSGVEPAVKSTLRPKRMSTCSLRTETCLVEHRIQSVLLDLQVECAARDIQVARHLGQVPLSGDDRSANGVPFDPAECGLSR